MKTYFRVASATFFATVLAGCSLGSPGFVGKAWGPDLVISGTESGIRAWGDNNSGLIMMGKSDLDPHRDNAHHEMRRTQERTRQMQYTVKKQGGQK